MKRVRWLTMGLLVGLMGACASTRVTSTWTDPTLAEQERPRKALVAAVVPDESIRRVLEERLVAQLREEGIDATPSFQFIPDVRELAKDNIREVAQAHGMDAILMTRFRGIQTRVNYSPGYTWDGYWGMWDPWMYQPGYITTETVARLETSLFVPKDGGRLVWTASSQTFNPTGSPRQLEGIARALVKRMEKDGVV